mmetsp:Transcript_35419/g.93826  ORF Transcript_35419/g.93826 Transcript_35419/m.93826 type:complete len:267 (+) Transcript_35419:987-1787(+)
MPYPPRCCGRSTRSSPSPSASWRTPSSTVARGSSRPCSRSRRSSSGLCRRPWMRLPAAASRSLCTRCVSTTSAPGARASSSKAWAWPRLRRTSASGRGGRSRRAPARAPTTAEGARRCTRSRAPPWSTAGCSATPSTASRWPAARWRARSSRRTAGAKEPAAVTALAPGSRAACCGRWRRPSAASWSGPSAASTRCWPLSWTSWRRAASSTTPSAALCASSSRPRPASRASGRCGSSACCCRGCSSRSRTARRRTCSATEAALVRL